MSTKVAIAQVAPMYLSLSGSVKKAVSVIKEAGKNGARLVAFPESWIPGYPLWLYGAKTGTDADFKRSFAKLYDNSIAFPSGEASALCQAAREASVIVVIGINEKENTYSRGTLYNSLLFISADGQILGVRRKLMPTHGERLFWGLGDGSHLEVYDTAIGKLGGAICWEHFMPLGRFAMHAQGEQIHVAAWPHVTEMHQVASRHYAFEGRSFVLATGTYLTLSDISEDFKFKEYLERYAKMVSGDDQGEGQLLVGGSGVIGPDGSWIVEPRTGQEEIIYAELDISRIPEELFSLDAAGHYNRPDIFHLSIDRRKKNPFEWIPAVSQQKQAKMDTLGQTRRAKES